MVGPGGGNGGDRRDPATTTAVAVAVAVLYLALAPKYPLKCVIPTVEALIGVICYVGE